MATQDLRNLIRKRGSVKARLTNYTKYIDELQNTESLEKVVLLQIELKLSKIESLLSEFEEYQMEIELLVNDDELNDQTKERNEFEDSYYNVVALYRSILQDNKDDAESVHSERGSRVSSNKGTGFDVQNNQLISNVRLPSIPIPKFNGNLENWILYRDTFEELIHNNRAVTNAYKFHYLRDSLEGEALDVVTGEDFNPSTYAHSWETLCENYNNDYVLANNQLKALFALPKIEKVSVVELRKLLNGSTKIVNYLEKLGVEVQTWDVVLIYIINGKLDNISKQKWEEIRPKKRFPKFTEFKDWFKERIQSLQTLESNDTEKTEFVDKNKNQGSRKKEQSSNQKHSKSFLVANDNCSYCSGKHSIANCEAFLKLSVYERYEKAKQGKLCLNCLKKGSHISKECGAGCCRRCSAKHHTLLHYEKRVHNLVQQQSESNAEQTKSTSSDKEAGATALVNSVIGKRDMKGGDVLLSTAVVEVVDANGDIHMGRVLLDNGSQSNLITKSLCDKLKLPMEDINISIVGINQVVSNIKHRCLVNIRSRHNGFESSVSCLVIDEISEAVPNHNLSISHLNIPGHIKLADPGFYKPGKIDLLLGVEIFYSLLCIGQINLGLDQPLLQKTKFGWVVSGPFWAPNKALVSRCNLSLNTNIHEQLEKFWAVEEPPPLNCCLSEDDKECENIFSKTVKRHSDGRFVVNIPLKSPPSNLGDSKENALRRFYSLEKRFIKNPEIKGMYIDFMEEYKSMGHMSLVETQSESSYYLPHHGVLKNDSLTTKLRVVFNGSAPSDNGISLNDLQYVGPSVQDELISILFRFRQYNVVVGADISKMYRMVLVDENQRSLQKILWRSSPEQKLQEYTLNTVTYGTKSAPFLAIRCLKQLGLDHLEINPKAAQVILHDFYVDDLLSGADTQAEAIELCNEVRSILKSACFELRKWISNDPQVIQHIPSDNIDFCKLQLGDKEQHKTLGLVWDFNNDVLMYKIEFSLSNKITKRSILGEISRIFDPLGLLGPCVILAKTLLQKLWTLKLDWDETLPLEMHTYWSKLKNSFCTINALKIPRQVVCTNYVEIDVHGFADASTDAYGACIYFRSVDHFGNIQVNLVSSKVKVAPIKSLTIPRLELCAALVLAQLLAKVVNSVTLKVHKIWLWSDSQVALSWISTSPHLLQTFVQNRVAQIQNLSHLSDWHYIRSEDNPADVLSRGLFPEKLIQHTMWWNGPSWLSLDYEYWPRKDFQMIDNLPEIKKQKQTFLAGKVDSFPFERFSKLCRLQRTVAYCLRFAHNSRGLSRMAGPLSVSELNNALTSLVRLVQQQAFGDIFNDLLRNKQIKAKAISKLCPFVDENGLIRVGGRLHLSDFDYAKKHPLLLTSHVFTKLLFEAEHLKLLHAGPQLLLNSIRENYWVLGGRNLAKKIVFNCVKCFKVNPRGITQQMGVLPKARVHLTFPFHTTGVDYAGPFNIKDKPGRGCKITKCYVCLFVCFATKAIHLELVSNLTSECFIAAFRRFVSRRGKPDTVYSDNGSTFVGANSELQDLGKFLHNASELLVDSFGNEGVNWKFIPPYSPNFGGLWEAGVKSSKHHLKRVMGNASVTFEQLYTLLTQVEAVLNSRPLTPLSASPLDLNALTPSHFLIGKRLTALPDPDVRHVPENRLSTYQHIQMLHQHFWSRWSRDYITELQQRQRWPAEQANIAVGQLVLVRDDNLPPLYWKLGRVEAIHPGPDKKSRVVTVKVRDCEIKRAISKVCPLPIENSVTTQD